MDVSYGGENGLNQAIELSADALSNVKFVQEKRLIGKLLSGHFVTFLLTTLRTTGKYFEEISQDTQKYCFGVDDTLKALEMGAVEVLICWENLDIMRYVVRNPTTKEERILHLTPAQEKEKTHLTDKETGEELETVEAMPLLEWLANNYKTFGATLEIITDRSQEGSQFVKGFGGIGGLLRYQVDLGSLALDEEDFDDFGDDI